MPLNTDTIDLLVTAAYRARNAADPHAQLEHADQLGQALADTTDTPIRDYHWQPVAELLSRGWSNDIVIQLERTRQLLDPIDHPTVRGFNNALAAAIRDRLGRAAGPVLTAQERTATRPLWTRPRLVMDLTAEGRA